MPLVTPLDALLAEVPLGTPLDPLPEPPQRPGVLDTLAAAERQFNPVTNWWEAAQNKPSTILERRGVKSTVESQPDQSPVPGYDWKTDIAGFEDYAIRFVRSESPAETQAIKDHIRTEASDKQTLRAAGGWGIASSFAVGLTDPVILASMLIPVAPALTGATRLGRVAAGIGAQMAVDTSEELYLHSQQELRTIGDSVFNIGAGALGTGLLGAIALRVPRAEFKAAVDAENALNETVDALRGRRLGAANELMPTKPFKETIAAQGDSWLSRQVDTATTRHPALNGGAKPLGKEVGGVVYAVEPPSSPGALNIAAYAETKPGYWTTVGRLVTDGVRTGADAPLGLRNLAVSESHRSKGVARMMLDTLREEATKANRKLDLSQVLGAELTPDGAKFLNKYFADVVSSPVNPNAPGSDSFGAAKAAVAETTLEDEGIASGGKAIAHTMGQVSPMTRVILSPAKTARQLVQKLVDIPYRLQKNLKGIANPQSVEGLTKRFVATRRWQGTKLLDAAVAEYKQAGGTLSRKEFSREVSLAMTRGDVHEIPQVATLAKWARTTFEDDKAILKEFGVDLADHPLGAKSYFPRVYDFDAIIKNRYTFEQMLYKWFRENPKATVKVLEDGTEERVVRELDEAELRDEVMKTVEHILGMPSTAADVNVRSLPGPLKSRVLDVPDELLSPYLVHDFETVMSGYARGMAPEIMFRKQGFSSPSMIKELEQVGEEFRVLKAQAGKDVAKIQKLDKAHTAAINDLKLLRDRLNNNVGLRGGQNRQWVRAARIMRLYNYTRLLGSQTLSSLSDYGQLIRRYGLPRTLASTAKFLTNWNANKLARADAHRLGTALEMVLDSRTQQIADILDELPRSRLEQGLQKIGNTFSRVSLMSPWNATIKSLATVLEQDALVRAVKNWDSLSAFQKSALVSNGIDEAAIKRIGPMLEKYGEDTSGLFRARTELWTDQAAAQLVENSIFKVADELVVTRGLGDLPAAMDGELVKTLLQFKSFAMSSVNRTMIPMAQGLAHGDLKTVQGMLSAMTLGMLTYYVKEHAAGRTPDLSAGRLSAEALNWSGSVGYFPEVWDPIASVVGLPRFSRFKSRSPTESWLGPTFGTSVDMLFGTVAGFADGEVTQKDIERLRRAVPYQNLFYIRRLFNAMEGEAGEAVNAKGSNVKTFGQRVTEEVPSR